MLEEFITAEVASLSERFGAPLRHSITLVNEGLFEPLSKTDRYGEVCMVIRRLDGRLLTARKTFYPPSAYRLLTGGIDYGERIYDALLRETDEETGLEVRVRRFLAMLDYRLTRPDGTHVEGSAALPDRPVPDDGERFRTFAFLLDEIGGVLAPRDPHERVELYQTIAVEDLPQMAERLEQLGQVYDPEIYGRWRDWGRFRAAVHRSVYEALTER